MFEEQSDLGCDFNPSQSRSSDNRIVGLHGRIDDQHLAIGKRFFRMSCEKETIDLTFIQQRERILKLIFCLQIGHRDLRALRCEKLCDGDSTAKTAEPHHCDWDTRVERGVAGINSFGWTGQRSKTIRI